MYKCDVAAGKGGAHCNDFVYGWLSWELNK